LLDRAIADSGSVRLSVHHTREPRLNGSRYRNAFCTARYSDVSSFKPFVTNLCSSINTQLHALACIVFVFSGQSVDSHLNASYFQQSALRVHCGQKIIETGKHWHSKRILAQLMLYKWLPVLIRLNQSSCR